MNALKRLQEFGQSVYLDEINRRLITSGELDTLITRDGLRGVTSNPAIFQKAIANSSDYDDEIRELGLAGDVDAVYEAVVVKDVQLAADRFRAMFDESGGRHGYVSLEVSPHLANDADATVAEALRLWGMLDRPNVFIKVPGTEAGVSAVRRLTGKGVSVNVTLLFGLDRYRAVAEAYIAGLEDRLSRGESVAGIASVASFFLSRIDTLIDARLDAIAEDDEQAAGPARAIRGQVAIASAKLAYVIYRELFHGPAFEALRAAVANPQYLLWASTSTKDPAYDDVKYVEALVGPDTINTMPPETLDAYRDHGAPAAKLEQGQQEAHGVLRQLEALGIDIADVTQVLEDEGVQKFVTPFDSLMATLRAAVDEA